MTIRVSLLIVIMAMISLSGCGYPEVSPQAYEVTKALYSACNRQSETHLTKIEELITERLEDSKISESEAEWLREIITNAKSGEWESAMLECREIMEDQINRREKSLPSASVHQH